MTDIIGSARLTLNNGRTMPVLGLGTWKSKPGEVKAAVEAAIDAGYRHIDCAFIYGNEKEVGEALQIKMKEGIKREDLFIVSKLWNTFHSKEDVKPAMEKGLKDLQLEYLDLYLIHSPIPFKRDSGLSPVDANGNIITSEVSYKETWKAMEELVDAGLTRAIGLSNFNSKQIDEICEISRIKPAVNQCESHPYLNQNKLIEHCKKYGIVFTAYSPLGTPDSPFRIPDDPVLLQDQTINEIAKKYNKSAAQICIKFHIQRGVTVVPKSVTPSRIQANAEMFDFTLSDEDLKSLIALNKDFRFCKFIFNVARESDGAVINSREHPLFPFNEPF